MSIGPFEFEVIVSLANQPDDAYGLTLRDRLNKSLNRNISIGAIYAALERLERKKLISSWWSEPTEERGGRRKRLYRVEASGRNAALEFERKFSVSANGMAIVGGRHP